MMMWAINARRYYVAQRHVIATVLTFSLFRTPLGMSKMISPSEFAYVSGHGLGTCYVTGNPWRHAIGCSWSYVRCPTEHPLGSVSMSTTLKEYQGSHVKHFSKFVSCRERCLLENVHIFSSMITSLCETSYVVIFDVSHDVPSVFFILQ